MAAMGPLCDARPRMGPMPPITGAWHEALVCVRDLDRWIPALEHLLGWTVQLRDDVDPRLLSAWGLPVGARGREALLVNPADPPRCVRLMQLSGVDQIEIRSSGNHWDTGGIFSLLSYVRDVDATFAAAQQLGWSAFHDPVDMHFGERVLRNVVLRGWDGVNFGLYRVLQPLQSDAVYPKAAMSFNAQQSVRDIEPARRFWRDLLGWHAWFDGVTHLACNNFGMPENYVGRMPKNVIISAGSKNVDGSWAHGQVELVQWVGFTGQDFAARAVPPNLGILAIRVPVPDADSTARELVERGGHLFMPPTSVTLAPHGEVRLCSVRSPDGAMIEFFSLRQDKT
jgi:catechol 2,3-dioxygenase-like lactoylglutathione lyase family enzyme